MVGRTGAGKTSLWGVLLGLMTSTQGAVLIDDVDTRSVPLHELRTRIAVVPQVGQSSPPFFSVVLYDLLYLYLYLLDTLQ